MANTYYQTPAIRIRLSLVIMVFGLISAGMLVRSTWLQIIHDPKLAKLARRQFESKIIMKPRRGLILDRTGEPLAINLETSSLAGSPAKILKSRTTLTLLAHALGTTPQALKKRLDSKKSFAWFERHVRDERMDQFRKLGIIRANGEMPEGIWIVKEMKRVYPHGEIATSLIGSVNIDTEGLEGVELWKNTLLRGKSASVEAFKDALGRPTLIDSNPQTKMVDGENITLSIDSSLQYSVEEALITSIEKSRADSGMVIVMDSSNGEILALAQAPSRRGVKKVTAITDGYEPGSTMKPLMLASALNKGVIRIQDQLFGHYGKLTIQKRTISEAEAHEKFGMISMKRMIEVSSNVVAAQLALKMGAERTVQGLREFGFGSRTGIAMPGEIAGWMPSQTKKIQPLTLATIGFGQSIMVTPLQMIRAYSSLSNGGYLVEPTLIKRGEKEIFKRIPVLKAAAARDATEALVQVTEGEKGTGHLARVEGYLIAGKTGTAQTVDPRTKKYSTSRHIASFIGYPVGVKQPITILTLLDNPRGIYYAGQTAAPLFSTVLKQVVSRFSIPTTEKIRIPLVESTPSPAPVKPAQVTDTVQVAQSSAEIIEQSLESTKEVNLDHPVMPSVIGLTPQEAMRALRPFLPKVQVHGFGLIHKQSPESGSMIAKGLDVTLHLGE